MNMDFGDGMRAAMRLITPRSSCEATRVIQSALSGRDQPTPPAEPAGTVRAIEGRVIDLTAEVVEPEVTNVAEDGASIAPELSLPPSAALWARRMGEMVPAHGDLGLATLQPRCAESRQTDKDCRDPGRRSVLEPVLCLRRREPRLQALRSAAPAQERARAAGDAAWRHAGWRRLRGGNPHERARRGAWVSSSPIRASPRRQRIAVLELVHAGEPEARGGRALHHCRHHEGDHRRITMSIRTACSSRVYPPEAPWRR